MREPSEKQTSIFDNMITMDSEMMKFRSKENHDYYAFV